MKVKFNQQVRNPNKIKRQQTPFHRRFNKTRRRRL
jgi:hypothetical protein